MSGEQADGRPEPRRLMYHYTDRTGYNGIRAGVDWRFKAGKPRPRSHPLGAYFTPWGPETPRTRLAMLFIPGRKREFVFAFEDLGDLIPLPGGRGLYVVYSPADYLVERARQVAHGASADVASRLSTNEEERS